MAPTIVVQRRSRVRPPLLVAAAVTILVIAVPVLFGLARNASFGESRRLVAEMEQARAQATAMARQVRDLESANAQLRQELTDLQKGRDIDRQAYAEVQKSLADQQQEVGSLREQLAFYRGVMSPQALQSGLHVNELRISRAGATDTYRYDLVLVQAARQERRASGRVELRFIGRDRVAQRSIALSELDRRSGPLQFSFRHFQEFGGEFRLPPGFKPQRAVVTLVPDDGGAPHVEQEFEWSRVQGAG